MVLLFGVYLARYLPSSSGRTKVSKSFLGIWISPVDRSADWIKTSFEQEPILNWITVLDLRLHFLKTLRHILTVTSSSGVWQVSIIVTEDNDKTINTPHLPAAMARFKIKKCPAKNGLKLI
jgi:hypothetical protein